MPSTCACESLFLSYVMKNHSPKQVHKGKKQTQSLFEKNSVDHTKVYDLCSLRYCAIENILACLKDRFDCNMIYTIARPLLVVMNPFKKLPIYTQAIANKYLSLSMYELEATDCEPHIFNITVQALRSMKETKKPQAIVVSGESGAGKTETTKHVMSFLALTSSGDIFSESQEDSNLSIVELSQKRALNMLNKNKSRNMGVSTIQEDVIDVQSAVLASNPLLEAFGNAKTSRNDNSSRFGRFCELHLGIQKNLGESGGGIQSGLITSFLLEKSRVAQHAVGERSFHVFYQLIFGCNSIDRQRYSIPEHPYALRCLVPRNSDGGLAVPLNTTKILHPTNPSLILPSIPESTVEAMRSDWQATVKSLRTVGLSLHQVECVKRILVGVLYLSSTEVGEAVAPYEPVRFKSSANPRGTSPPASIIHACSMFGIDINDTVDALLVRTIKVGGQVTLSPLTCAESAQRIQAFAKTAYERLFLWLIGKINRTIKGSGNCDDDTGNVVGILDIFGFEFFENNSLEQFLINYANERLQQLFIIATFKKECSVLEDEGVDPSCISFTDNHSIICTLDDTSMGIKALLEEQCILARGSDQAFLASVLRYSAQPPVLDGSAWRNDMNEALIFKPAAGINSANNNTTKGANSTSIGSFAVRHTAGVVSYRPEGFVLKNRDILSWSMIGIVQQQGGHLNGIDGYEGFTNNSVKDEDVASVVSFRRSSEVGSDIGSKTAINSVMKESFFGLDSSAGGRTLGRGEFIFCKFIKEMDALVGALQKSNCFFVRCLKPNKKNQPLLWDDNCVAEQLEALSVLEAIELQNSGFPFRLAYPAFIRKFSIFSPKQRSLIYFPPPQSHDEEIAEVRHMLEVVANLKPNEWEAGKTKVFITKPGLDKLDEAYAKHMRFLVISAKKIQYVARISLAQVHFENFKRRLQSIHNQVRRYNTIKMSLRLRRDQFLFKGIIRVLFVLGVYFPQRARSIVTLQNSMRTFLCRRSWHQHYSPDHALEFACKLIQRRFRFIRFLRAMKERVLERQQSRCAMIIQHRFQSYSLSRRLESFRHLRLLIVLCKGFKVRIAAAVRIQTAVRGFLVRLKNQLLIHTAKIRSRRRPALRQLNEAAVTLQTLLKTFVLARRLKIVRRMAMNLSKRWRALRPYKESAAVAHQAARKIQHAWKRTKIILSLAYILKEAWYKNHILKPSLLWARSQTKYLFIVREAVCSLTENLAGPEVAAQVGNASLLKAGATIRRFDYDRRLKTEYPLSVGTTMAQLGCFDSNLAKSLYALSMLPSIICLKSTIQTPSIAESFVYPETAHRIRRRAECLQFQDLNNEDYEEFNVFGTKKYKVNSNAKEKSKCSYPPDAKGIKIAQVLTRLAANGHIVTRVYFTAGTTNNPIIALALTSTGLVFNIPTDEELKPNPKNILRLMKNSKSQHSFSNAKEIRQRSNSPKPTTSLINNQKLKKNQEVLVEIPPSIVLFNSKVRSLNDSKLPKAFYFAAKKFIKTKSEKLLDVLDQTKLLHAASPHATHSSMKKPNSSMHQIHPSSEGYSSTNTPTRTKRLTICDDIPQSITNVSSPYFFSNNDNMGSKFPYVFDSWGVNRPFLRIDDSTIGGLNFPLQPLSFDSMVSDQPQVLSTAGDSKVVSVVGRRINPLHRRSYENNADDVQIGSLEGHHILNDNGNAKIESVSPFSNSGPNSARHSLTFGRFSSSSGSQQVRIKEANSPTIRSGWSDIDAAGVNACSTSLSEFASGSAVHHISSVATVGKYVKPKLNMTGIDIENLSLKATLQKSQILLNSIISKPVEDTEMKKDFNPEADQKGTVYSPLESSSNATTKNIALFNTRLNLYSAWRNADGHSGGTSDMSLEIPPNSTVSSGLSLSLWIGLRHEAWLQSMSSAYSSVIRPISFPERVITISAGLSHVLSLAASGSVFAWGDNQFGQCGVSHPVFDLEGVCRTTGSIEGDLVIHQPRLIKGLQFVQVSHIAAGDRHSLCWGIPTSANAPSTTSAQIDASKVDQSLGDLFGWGFWPDIGIDLGYYEHGGLVGLRNFTKKKFTSKNGLNNGHANRQAEHFEQAWRHLIPPVHDGFGQPVYPTLKTRDAHLPLGIRFLPLLRARENRRLNALDKKGFWENERAKFRSLLNGNFALAHLDPLTTENDLNEFGILLKSCIARYPIAIPLPKAISEAKVASLQVGKGKSRGSTFIHDRSGRLWRCGLNSNLILGIGNPTQLQNVLSEAVCSKSSLAGKFLRNWIGHHQLQDAAVIMQKLFPICTPIEIPLMVNQKTKRTTNIESSVKDVHLSFNSSILNTPPKKKNQFAVYYPPDLMDRIDALKVEKQFDHHIGSVVNLMSIPLPLSFSNSTLSLNTFESPDILRFKSISLGNVNAAGVSLDGNSLIIWGRFSFRILSDVGGVNKESSLGFNSYSTGARKSFFNSQNLLNENGNIVNNDHLELKCTCNKNHSPIENDAINKLKFDNSPSMSNKMFVLRDSMCYISSPAPVRKLNSASVSKSHPINLFSSVVADSSKQKVDQFFSNNSHNRNKQQNASSSSKSSKNTRQTSLLEKKKIQLDLLNAKQKNVIYSAVFETPIVVSLPPLLTQQGLKGVLCTQDGTILVVSAMSEIWQFNTLLISPSSIICSDSFIKDSANKAKLNGASLTTMSSPSSDLSNNRRTRFSLGTPRGLTGGHSTSQFVGYASFNSDGSIPSDCFIRDMAIFQLNSNVTCTSHSSISAIWSTPRHAGPPVKDLWVTGGSFGGIYGVFASPDYGLEMS